MISITIRYHKNARPTVLNLDISGKTTIEEIAKQGSKKLAKAFKRYATGISERSLEKYRFAQYMMLKNKLAEVSRDVEVELNYDSRTAITTFDGVYDYDMTDDIMTKVDFLIEGGAGYSVYSQEDEWFEELEEE